MLKNTAISLLIFVFSSLFTVNQVIAQENVTISGAITDAVTNEPVSWVNVRIKGTEIDTVSDANGQFILEATSSNVTLLFSSAGYVTREINTDGQTTINVTLSSAIGGSSGAEVPSSTETPSSGTEASSSMEEASSSMEEASGTDTALGTEAASSTEAPSSSEMVSGSEATSGTQTEAPTVSKIPIKISGLITDGSTDQPVFGVRVLVKGTSIDTLSDKEGRFTLEVPTRDATLVFTSSGYSTKEVNAAGKTTLNVALMTSETLNLGTDVVVGYGTQKKVDLTGAVTSVRADELVKVVSANVVSSLQGAASGVYVTQSSGRPGGAGLDIQIRGLKSLTASNKPLYVIDGLPLAPGAEDIMGEINPGDIESIDILKDAASCAIYGSRGANGVVMITTKRGTKTAEGSGKDFKVKYSFYTGITDIVHKLDIFDGPEWLAMKREAYRTDGLDTSLSNLLDNTQMDVYNKGEWVDWQDELFKTGFQMNNNISVSGGTEKMQALFSLGNFYEEGIFNKSDYLRNSGRLNVDYAPNSKFKISASVLASITELDATGGDSTNKNDGQTTAGGLTVIQSPAFKLYDSNGDLQLFGNSEQAIGNPLFLIQESTEEIFRNRVMVSANASYEFIPGLAYKISGGAEYLGFKYGRYKTRAYNNGGLNYATLGFGQTFNYTFDNVLTYKKAINDDHNIDVTLLYGVQGNKLDTLASRSRNLPTDLLGYDIVHQGTEMMEPVRNFDEWKLESYMGRLRYSLLDKYLLTISTRVDGSSKFGKNNKYGFFPSAAVAWKIDHEDFMEDVTVVDLLKLRVSFGTIGNQDIPSYRALAQSSVSRYSFDNVLVAGSNFNTFGNPNLKWETTQEFNVGLDFGILDSRLDGSVECYMSSTKDLLLARAISSANGDTAMYDNIGKTKSYGVEANIVARVIKSENPKGFRWSISANVAAERNEIVATSLKNEKGKYIDDVGNKWFIGEPIKVNYDWVFDGIWQTGEDHSLMPDAEPGDIKVKDLNGDGVINAEDRKVLGSELPDWYGGITNTVSFMGFELSTFFVGRFGVQRRNQVYKSLTGRFNSLDVDYWTPENPSNTYPRPSNKESPDKLSTLYYTDASYVALKNVTLSYFVPEDILNKMKIFESLSLYIQGTNLKYWTEYESYNPESDYGAYPMTRSYGFGINAGF